jgi:SAM-dependent methyltransferase
MRIPTHSDFEDLNRWGIVSNPSIAISDYSKKKEELRWENQRHNDAHEKYHTRRKNGLGEGTQEYYREMSRPIDRVKWEFLKRRKSWYICPTGWQKFAGLDVSRILDLGCGDGDVTQRIAEYITGQWQQTGHDGTPVEIIGIDLNKSRVENARRLTKSPHKKITLSFEVGDASKGLEFESNYFDYVVSTGVMEILPDDIFEEVINEISRLSAYGVYIEDLIDKYPGGYPREELGSILENYNFNIQEQHKVFQEPFVKEGTKDPLEIWPMCVVQILFAERDAPITHENRW